MVEPQAGYPLARLTTVRAGGAADHFARAGTLRELQELLEWARQRDLRVQVLGSGSNLLVADAGVRGLVLKLERDLARIEPDGEGLRVGAGARLPAVAARSAAAGLAGIEFGVNIPGTVGGAVAMNAGGHGSTTGDRLVSARIVDLVSGRERTVGPDGLDLSYRHSNVLTHEIVLEARFAGTAGARAAAEAEISAIVRWRRANQPGGRNAGSVFTNPPGDSAGRLIESCGLKGYRIGSAEVSSKHANFFQCDADGCADDIIELIEAVRGLVLAATGVELSTELRIVGPRR